MQGYKNRIDAGQRLATLLGGYQKDPKAIVLALPRGGVPVAYEVATALGLPLDIIIVRKLGVPGFEELAMGAISSGNTLVLNEDVIQSNGISKASLDRAIKRETAELQRREHVYRGQRPYPKLRGKTILLIDDGIATGATIKAAIKALRQHQPAEIILAVPVAADSTCDELESLVDTIICPLRPFLFNAVGSWYQDFSQTTDDEVIDLLSKASAKP